MPIHTTAKTTPAWRRWPRSHTGNSRSFREAGPAMALSSAFGRATRILETGPAGTAALVYAEDTGTGRPLRPMWLWTALNDQPFRGAETLSVPHRLVDPWLAPRAGGFVFAATRSRYCGDSGCYGDPVVWTTDFGGTARFLGGPKLRRAAFAPSVASISPGAIALVFQQRAVTPIATRAGPIRAAILGDDGAVAAMQTLSSRSGVEPQILTLTGGRVVAIWTERARWRAALSDADGRFTAVAAPKGAGPDDAHTSAGNRAADSAGAWIAIAWSHRRVIRVAVRRF